MAEPEQDLDGAEVAQRLEAAKRGSPAQQVAGRVEDLEKRVTLLTERAAETFAAFDQEVTSLFDLAALQAAAVRRIHDVLKILVSNPENPHSAAQEALELLEAPLDIGNDEAEPGSDDVVPEPEGDQQPDAG